MTDRTERSTPIKRTAIILGIAAALVVPAGAAAGNVTAQVKPQNRVQVITTQIATAQVVTAHRVKAQRSTVQVAKLQRATAARTLAKRKSARLATQRSFNLTRLGDSGPCGSETFEIVVNGRPKATLC